MSVAGSFIGLTERDIADFAAASAFSLPGIPTWLVIQQRTMFCHFLINSVVLQKFLNNIESLIDCRLDIESEKITKCGLVIHDHLYVQNTSRAGTVISVRRNVVWWLMSVADYTHLTHACVFYNQLELSRVTNHDITSLVHKFTTNCQLHCD